jgi:hypothetical protein
MPKTKDAVRFRKEMYRGFTRTHGPEKTSPMLYLNQVYATIADIRGAHRLRVLDHLWDLDHLSEDAQMMLWEIKVTRSVGKAESLMGDLTNRILDKMARHCVAPHDYRIVYYANRWPRTSVYSWWETPHAPMYEWTVEFLKQPTTR